MLVWEVICFSAFQPVGNASNDGSFARKYGGEGRKNTSDTPKPGTDVSFLGAFGYVKSNLQLCYISATSFSSGRSQPNVRGCCDTVDPISCFKVDCTCEPWCIIGWGKIKGGGKGSLNNSEWHLMATEALELLLSYG